MPSIINGKEAHGSIINGQIQFEGEGWFPLTLAENISGNVLAKADRKNGQVLLQGGIVTSTVTSGSDGHFILIPSNDIFGFTAQGIYVGTGDSGNTNINSTGMLGSDSDGNLWMNGSFGKGCSLIFREGWHDLGNVNMGPVRLSANFK